MASRQFRLLAVRPLVNLILFEPAEIRTPLPRVDPRANHLLQVLRRKEGDTFDAGLINGPSGKGTLVAIQPEALVLDFIWGVPSPPLDPVALIVGLPRPQTARKILQEATSLGVAEIHFVTTARGEASYALSTLWRSGEWRRHLIAGAEQAFCTRLPEVTFGRSMREVLEGMDPGPNLVALDNYEAQFGLGSFEPQLGGATALVVGSERGWTNPERELLREHRFAFAHLGSRILRTETAAIVALALLRAKLGLLG